MTRVWIVWQPSAQRILGVYADKQDANADARFFTQELHSSREHPVRVHGVDLEESNKRESQE